MWMTYGMHHHYQLCTTFLSKQVLVWFGFGVATVSLPNLLSPVMERLYVLQNDEWSQGSEDGTFGEKEDRWT